jgi:hypothetical protein
MNSLFFPVGFCCDSRPPGYLFLHPCVVFLYVQNADDAFLLLYSCTILVTNFDYPTGLLHLIWLIYLSQTLDVAALPCALSAPPQPTPEPSLTARPRAPAHLPSAPPPTPSPSTSPRVDASCRRPWTPSSVAATAPTIGHARRRLCQPPPTQAPPVPLRWCIPLPPILLRTPCHHPSRRRALEFMSGCLAEGCTGALARAGQVDPAGRNSERRGWVGFDCEVARRDWVAQRSCLPPTLASSALRYAFNS